MFVAGEKLLFKHTLSLAKLLATDKDEGKQPKQGSLPLRRGHGTFKSN